MSLTINHNQMALNATRNLSQSYGRLNTSVQRLSSGLRINSAADDAAGLAIREMMRSDIATTQQGIRNAADAISLIQTADGALGVIDEKLTRMKELAEQAANGTYTTVQRDIINSEYQAMAAEIDRIANATNFNGIKLLDGSVSNQHGGRGLKMHFGTSNNEAEDYYFVNIGDARATSNTGLRVGGDAKNDIWAQGAAASGPMAGPGCCTGGWDSLNGEAGFTSGQHFSFGYNWDWQEDEDPALLNGRYLAGRYQVGSGDSLQDLVNKVNQGTQSRVGIRLDADTLNDALAKGGLASICIGDEAYVLGSATATGTPDHLILTTTTAEQVDTYYNPGIYYTNRGITTYVYSSTQIAQALRDLGMGNSSSLPIQSDSGMEFNSASTSYIQGQMAPKYQEAIDLHVAANWQADRQRLTGGSVTRTELTNALLGTHGTAMYAALSDGLGVPQPNRSYTFTTGYYMNGTGVAVTDATLANELGLPSSTNMEITVATKDAGSGFMDVELYINGTYAARTNVVGSESMVKWGAEFMVGEAIRIGLGGNDGTRISSGGAYGQPTVNPAAINVTSGRRTSTLELHDKEVTVLKDITGMGSADAATLASAINHNADSQFWAMVDPDDEDMLYVFNKDGGDFNSILACETGADGTRSREALDSISFQNAETGRWDNSGASFSLGGQKWASLTPALTRTIRGHEVWNLSLSGRDVGRERDLWIANFGELNTPGLSSALVTGLDRDSFIEIQNADDAQWKGAEVRTQSSAQEALDALTEAITKKDKIRADLGALQNRLENTMTNLEIQAENLQASESRISDVDVAQEMTEFTKNNVLVQAGVSMLAQANSMSQLALSLLG